MTAKQEQALQVLAKVLKKNPAEIKLSDELAADLGVDSPKALQLLMELEQSFQMEISGEDAARMATVQDILAYVEKS
jgi:acyl carrier protein